MLGMRVTLTLGMETKNYTSKTGLFKKISVQLCVSSVVLCVTITRDYTELHREDTENHRVFLKHFFFDVSMMKKNPYLCKIENQKSKIEWYRSSLLTITPFSGKG